jgi:carbon storage regulator
MLVLSRKPGQTIVVGEIVFKVVEIRGGKVRVAVEAPRHVQIVRGELVEGSTETAEAGPDQPHQF